MWPARSSMRAAARLPPGTRVLLQPGSELRRLSRMCAAGRDNLCPDYDVLGYMSDGGYAEFVSVPVENLVPIPDAIDFVNSGGVSADFSHGVAHADHARRSDAGRHRPRPRGRERRRAGGDPDRETPRRARLRDRVGRRSCSRRASSAPKRRSTTTPVISRRSSRARTDGRGADIVVEHVGEATWERSVRALARGGRLVTCGATTGHAAGIDLRHLFARQLSLLGCYMGTKAELVGRRGALFRREADARRGRGHAAGGAPGPPTSGWRPPGSSERSSWCRRNRHGRTVVRHN